MPAVVFSTVASSVRRGTTTETTFIAAPTTVANVKNPRMVASGQPAHLVPLANTIQTLNPSTPLIAKTVTTGSGLWTGAKTATSALLAEEKGHRVLRAKPVPWENTKIKKPKHSAKVVQLAKQHTTTTTTVRERRPQPIALVVNWVQL